MFWKHITPTLPEPIRARHLLVYCAKRALDESVPPATDALKGKSKDKAKGGVRTDEGDRLVKEIMEEVMANLGKGLIDTNIFSQPVSRRPRWPRRPRSAAASLDRITWLLAPRDSGLILPGSWRCKIRPSTAIASEERIESPSRGRNREGHQAVSWRGIAAG
jgi:hypothetical protein